MRKRITGYIITIILLCTTSVAYGAETYQMLGSTNYYEIKNIELFDESNNVTEDIVDNGIINSITIKELVTSAPTAVAIIATYSSVSKLHNLKSIPLVPSGILGTEQTYSVNLSLGSNGSNLIIKVFIWDEFSGIIPLAGVFTPTVDKSTISISSIINKDTIVTLKASNIETFVNRIYTISYDDNYLEMNDAFADTKKLDINIEQIENSDITIVENSDGILSFTVNKNIPENNLWTGILNKVKFKGTQDGISTITISIS